MALILTEGWDQGDSGSTWWNNGEARWSQSNGNAGNCYPNSSYVRHGQYALHYSSGGAQQAARRGIPATQTIIMGMAILHNGGDGYQFRALFRFWQGGNMHVTVHYDYTNSKLLVYRGDGALGTGTLLGQTSTGVHTADGIWHYWECKVTIDGTSGVVQVKRDGTTLINLTSVNTQNGGTANVDTVECCTMSYYQNQIIDDVYVVDTTGSTNNDFLGDITIETLHPNGNGTFSQLAGSDGNSVNNYQLVNDWSDSTWTDGTNTGDTDTYNYGNSGYSVPSTILGVAISSRAYKTDTGSRSIANVAYLGGTTQTGADYSFPTTGVTWVTQVMETKPGGGAWTTTDINNAEFGVVARP